MADASADRNFILQQGLDAPAPGACPLLTSALLFQPRVVGLWALVGAAFQSPTVFGALAAVLWWSAALPGLNPFDAVFNRGFAARGGLPMLEPAPAPRRAAQVLAGALSLGIAGALATGASFTAMLIEAFFFVAVAALVFGRFCFGSCFYHVMRGRIGFALRTLPWSRG